DAARRVNREPGRQTARAERQRVAVRIGRGERQRDARAFRVRLRTWIGHRRWMIGELAHGGENPIGKPVHIDVVTRPVLRARRDVSERRDTCNLVLHEERPADTRRTEHLVLYAPGLDLYVRLKDDV